VYSVPSRSRVGGNVGGARRPELGKCVAVRRTREREHMLSLRVGVGGRRRGQPRARVRKVGEPEGAYCAAAVRDCACTGMGDVAMCVCAVCVRVHGLCDEYNEWREGEGACVHATVCVRRREGGSTQGASSAITVGWKSLLLCELPNREKSSDRSSRDANTKGRNGCTQVGPPARDRPKHHLRYATLAHAQPIQRGTNVGGARRPELGKCVVVRRTREREHVLSYEHTSTCVGARATRPSVRCHPLEEPGVPWPRVRVTSQTVTSGSLCRVLLHLRTRATRRFHSNGRPLSSPFSGFRTE
jgi:hypothetical protein